MIYKKKWVGYLFLLLLFFPGCSSSENNGEPSLKITRTSPKKLYPDIAFENELVELVNQTRKDYGCSLLQVKEKLNQVARLYSKRMIRENFFSHTDPQGNGLTYRLKKAGISRNYWNVRRNLKTMAEEGIFVEKKTIRLLDNNLMTSRRVTSVEVCEFHLDENVFSALHEALKIVFRTELLSLLYSA